MSETNKALVRRSFNECLNTGDFTTFNDIVANNYVYQDPAVGTKKGHQDFESMMTMYRTAFPDLHFTIEEQIAEGNKVVTRWTATATHKGEYLGIKPTGKRTTVSGILISTIENGKIVNDVEAWDALGLLTQLGALPSTVKVAA